MRVVFAIVAVLALCQCASARDALTVRPIVIVGVAEAPDNVDPRYTMLWRKVDEERGRFADHGGRRMVEITTNGGGTLRVPGIPGEFIVARVDPGVFALDGIYATLHEGTVVYTAQGSIIGPERPGFEARRGEVIYLGIWQASLDGHLAVVRPWRLSEEDLHAVARAAEIEGVVHLRSTRAYSVPCAPHRMHPSLAREIC
jgi:hypothetical protein